MECVQYTVPSVAYPRYDYSLRHHTSFIDRVNTLFQDLELERQVESLKFSLAEIQVVNLSPSAVNIDKLAIQQRPSDKVETETRTIKDVELFLKENPLNEKFPRLLVVSFDKVPENVDAYKDNLKNVLFVAQNDELAGALKRQVGEEKANELVVTTKTDLGKEIAFTLERVVFRHIANIVPVLRSMCEGSHYQEAVLEILRETARSLLKTLAATTYLKGQETEFIVEFPDLKDYLEISARHQQASTKQGDEKAHGVSKEEFDRLLKVPGFLKEIPDIDNKYTVGRSMWYYQIYKMSAHLANSLEQKIGSIYKEISPVVRERLPSCAHPVPSEIQSTLQKQFLTALNAFIVSDETTEEHFGTTEKLLTLLRVTKADIIENVLAHTYALPVVQALNRHVELVKENKQAIAGFVGEVTGMYNRSKVPQYERPMSPVRPKKLSEKVAKQLFENIGQIKGCGYRYNKLTIFLEKEPGTKADTMTVEGKIKNILNKYGISEFDITPATKSVKHYRQVGAKIKAWRCGTLGGFAVMKQPANDVLCALVSMHVVNGAQKLLWVNNGDEDIQIGSMIRAEGHREFDGLVDVAAAKILPDKVDICDTSFKDTTGNNLPSRLYDTNDDPGFLFGLPVHIYGATTHLGKGVISIPQYYANEPNEPDQGGFVVIEDVKEGKKEIVRFSSEGDSGAVICAEDPDRECVHVISMLIGCMNYQVIEDDPKKEAKYITFRMTSAFEKLKKETGHMFELCRGPNTAESL